MESSVKATQSAEQVILNNIANANTVGFKRSRVLFGDEWYRQVAVPGQVDQEGRPSTLGAALGTDTRAIANQFDVSQGRLRHTKQQLDLAIQGDGYFQINDGRRILYTRSGAFSVNANGQIVLVSNNHPRLLEPSITIPVDSQRIEVSHDGIVSVQQPAVPYMMQIGQIQLARFIDPRGLVAHGESLFENNGATGHPVISTPGENGLGEIRQEYLEESNVVVADESAELRRLQKQLKTLRRLQRELGGSDVGR